MLKSWKLSLCLTASVFAILAPRAASAQEVGTLTGVIKDAAGTPVAGAFVQMRNAERRLNFMVITHEEGKYTNNRLPPGKYVVQAIGGEQQSAPSAPVEVVAGGCHDSQRIVRSRGAPARWQQVIDTMKAYAQGSTVATPITDDEQKVLLAYVSANFGPAPGGPKPKPDPFSRLPRTLQPPEARDYIVVEYDLVNPRAEPHEMAVDPASASTTQTIKAKRRGQPGEISKIDGGPNRRWLSFDPKTEQFTVYNLPATTSGNASGNTMRVHPDNTVWLASIGANQVVRFDPATNKFAFFDVPAGVKAHKNATPYGLAFSGDGNVWVVENAVDQIARIDPKSGAFEEFPLPVKDPVARKLGADWDGNIWVGLHGAGKLLRVDYKTLKMTEFTPPSADAGVYLADPDMKNHLIWASEHHVDKIGRLDPATGTWTEFPLMTAETDVRRIEVDPNNPKRVWYSGVLSSKLGYIEMLK